MQALDKITARISTLSAPVGVAQQFGTLEVTVQRCAFHPPEETPENAAFVVIRDLGYGQSVAPAECFLDGCFHQARRFRRLNTRYMISRFLPAVLISQPPASLSPLADLV